MRKIFIGAFVVSISAGAIYWWYKNKKNIECTTSEETKNEANFGDEKQDDSDEMNELKEEKNAEISIRHAETVGIMSDSFKKIMKEIPRIDNFPKQNESIIDSVDQKIIDEQSDISDELDELMN